ncbi:PFN4 [Branchiostoma lanceolatum]|uniref:Profilin n=1 Tax=Branchiostoma lanceolatum TaxID=7740 RepID=A0A8J9VY59_BRALA|nr:PFN4 [Branchiostoma lanceolatum]
MSWQAYVDTNMVGTGHVSKGAILGLDGTVWAKSPDFNISAPEAQHIAQNISNPGALQGSGARVEEEKHFCVRADGSFAYTKKGDSGMCIVKCKQCK